MSPAEAVKNKSTLNYRLAGGEDGFGDEWDEWY
jgi:hypothetical protein